PGNGIPGLKGGCAAVKSPLGTCPPAADAVPEGTGVPARHLADSEAILLAGQFYCPAYRSAPLQVICVIAGHGSARESIPGLKGGYAAAKFPLGTCPPAADPAPEGTGVPAGHLADSEAILLAGQFYCPACSATRTTSCSTEGFPAISPGSPKTQGVPRSEEHTSELQSRE